MVKNIRNDASATYVDVECLNHAAHYGGCYHSHRWSVPHLAGVWGSIARFKRQRFVCTHCGSRRFDLSWRCPYDQGGHAIWPSIEYNQRMTTYRWRHLETRLYRGTY